MSGDVKMPKGGLFGPDGKLSAAGHQYLAKLGNRKNEATADTAEEVLAGGVSLIRAEGLWGTMEAQESSGSDYWTPDLGSRVDFKRTLTGPTTITFPSNIPEDSLLFFSVLLIQDSAGGWPVAYGDGFVGEAPVLIDGPGDMNLVGFKVLSRDPDTFCAWTVKAIAA